jgi:hypothetical protein
MARGGLGRLSEGSLVNVRVITSVFIEVVSNQLRHFSVLTIHRTDFRSSTLYIKSTTRLPHLPPQHSLLQTHIHTDRYPHPSKNIRHTTQNSKMPKSTPNPPTSILKTRNHRN